ncbi:hypothetical protein BH10BAC5_BH10BAC5_28090 [soil metagenome]
MQKKILITILFLLVLSNGSAFSQIQKKDVVFLFDNSGSMSGFYRQENSAFRLFSKTLIRNAVSQSDDASIMLFTKNDPARKIESPKILFSGSGKELNPADVISKFQLTKGSDQDFGKTDLIEALDHGINAINQKTGIIWLLTDNINDNSGSGDSSYKNTLDFYMRLRNDNGIRKILMFPIPDHVYEDGYTSEGYILYGIVYSKEDLSQSELEEYDAYLRGVGIKQKAITLKPLDIGTIILIPKVTQSRISPLKLYYDGKKITGYGFEEGEKVKETFSDLSLRSVLYPYLIKSATLSVRLSDFKSSDYSVKSMGTLNITPSSVSNVSPEGEVKGFSLIFNLPEITPNFSFNTIFKEDFTIGGDLLLEVSQVDIVLDQEYMKSFSSLFALSSVPEIFQPVLKDKKITTHIPLEIKMKYGPWRMFVLLGLAALIFGLLSLFLILALKRKSYTLMINNNEKYDFFISAFSSYDVNYGFAHNLGKIKKSLFGGLSFQNSRQTDTPGKTFVMRTEVPYTIGVIDTDMRTQQATIIVSETAKKKEDTKGMEIGSDLY